MVFEYFRIVQPQSDPLYDTVTLTCGPYRNFQCLDFLGKVVTLIKFKTECVDIFREQFNIEAVYGQALFSSHNRIEFAQIEATDVMNHEAVLDVGTPE